MTSEMLIVDLCILEGYNPRKYWNPKKTEQMTNSIREKGVEQSLIVRLNGRLNKDTGNLMADVVDGHRRLSCAKEAGLTKVPVDIREMIDEQVKDLMFTSHFNKEDLDPLDLAYAIKERLDNGSHTQESLGKIIGKSQSYIANLLRLLQAPDELKEMLSKREISPRHIITLLPFVTYPLFHEKLLSEMKVHLEYKGSLSVYELEEIILDSVLNDSNNSFVLDLNSFPSDIWIYQKEFDREGCQECKHVYRGKDVERVNLFCLDTVCWRERLENAKKALMEILTKLEVIDLSTLEWHQYEQLKEVLFDISECETCRLCKRDSENLQNLVCINPGCCKKKKAAHTKVKNLEDKLEEERAWEYFDKTLLTEDLVLTGINIKFMLESLDKILDSKTAKAKALEPWGKEVSDVTNYFDGIALLRFIISHRLEKENKGPATVKSMKKALKGYVEG